MDRMSGPESLPLHVEVPPSGNGGTGSERAIAWARRHRDWVFERMLRHGAVLVRGTGLRTAEDFEEFCGVFSSRLCEYTRGGGPRTRVRGNIYTSTDLPPGVVIPPHCEMAYAVNYPRRLLFFCMTPPRRGGETALVDMRRVFERLGEDVRDRFARRGVRYIENVPGRTLLSFGRTWQAMFETGDPEEVMRRCRELSIAATWRRNRTLHMVSTRPALMTHPETGETVWFNSVHLYHHSWSSEARRSGRYGLYAVARLREAYHGALFNPDEYRTHGLYGDGGPIPRREIEHIRDVLWREAVLVSWRQGDILLVDNLLVAHGRMPYRGPRKILAALAAE